ncbi:MAG: 23S rRNA (guanosine(2251)-2'-O)-methyltransferase RlmB [Planctomycetaceae bacterium]|nr:23S rRNA (guanosine(2251)-2'-O)-methyltransferase RlmB [Planctomycetaceae bacterium]
MARESKSTRGTNHNRAWLWGRHAVMETLRAGRWIPFEVAVSPRCPPEITQEVYQYTQQHSVALIKECDADLAKRCRSEEHQGIAVRLPEYPYASFDELCGTVNVWLVLDRIHDSHNFGAMVRSAVGLGVEAVLVGETKQSAINRQVVQSSAGAVNLLPIARVANLVKAMDSLRDRGMKIVAASEKAEQTIFTADLRPPVAIIIGNEGRGVDAALLERCTLPVRIPMANQLGSLNAAVAAGIVCYEMLRQRERA